MEESQYTRLLQNSYRLRRISLTLVIALSVGAGVTWAEPIVGPGESWLEGGTARDSEFEALCGPTASLEVYLRARNAWKSGETTEALTAYQEAGSADRGALAPRIAAGFALIFRDPPGAIDAWRDAARVLWEDYRSERWVVRNAIVLIALTGCFGGVALSLGLVLKHIRIVHHTLSETLSWAISAGKAAPALAWALLAFPMLAGAGIVASSLFYLFMCSSRLRGGERILALWAAVWAILLGPALTACSPLWSRHPFGRDATLVAEIQLDPAGRQNLTAIEGWLSEDPDSAIPRYLAGMSLYHQGDAKAAVELLISCRASGIIPASVLDNNLANVWAALDRDDLAIQHYQRAIAGDSGCFEAHYNLSAVQARNGRYLEADRALDAASRVDLDRLRDLGRLDDSVLEGKPLDASLSPGHLWMLDLSNPSGADPPFILASLFPLRSLPWGGVLALMAVLFGLWADRWIRRLLNVHVCYQCGAPVCRRCLARLDRRAYCNKCAESMGGLGAGESTRVLIRRLLDERPTWRTQGATMLTCALPGAGALIRGTPGYGALASLLAGLAAALWLYPMWGTPYSPVAGPGLWHDLARSAAIAALLLSYAITIAATHSSPQRRGSLRAFLNRDVDRIAA